MIMLLDGRYVESAQRLWERVFCEDEKSVRFYFEHIYPKSEMLVDTEDGKVVSMLTLLPLKIGSGETDAAARCVYAVATHEDYRNEGRSTRLINYAHEYMKEKGVSAAVVTPAEKGLFTFYERFGYESVFKVGYEKFRAGESGAGLDGYTVLPCGVHKYFELRKNAFGDCMFAEWGEDMLGEIMAYERLGGGEFYLLCGHGSEAAVHCERCGSELYVKEIASCTMDAGLAAQILCRYFGCGMCRVRIGYGGKDFAMMKRFDGKNGGNGSAYFNLAME